MSESLDTQVAPKNPWIAAGLSLIWPGLGHFYAGKTVPGVLFAFTCLITFGLMGRFTSAINAAMAAKHHNLSAGLY